LSDPDNIEAKDSLLLAMLPHVLFDGWTFEALNAGQEELEKNVGNSNGAHFDSLSGVAVHFGNYIDRQMLAAIEVLDLEKMPVRERIATCIRVRLSFLVPYKEAIQRLLTFLAIPGNHLTGLRITIKTVDLIWYATGDTATDFNYYTKRGLLAGVYGSTVLYWLSDTSENSTETDAFLLRRISEVMQIPKLQSKATKQLKNICHPIRRLTHHFFC
jgi:ubiquinone biosynthesis protein COQ9